MPFSVLLLLVGLIAGGRCGVLYHRQHAATAQSPEYHLHEGRYLRPIDRPYLPFQVALGSVPAVSAVPAVPALPPGSLVLATPQFLLPRVAFAIPQHYHTAAHQQFLPEQYNIQPSQNLLAQQRSKPVSESQSSRSYDHYQGDEREKPYSRIRQEQFHYTNKQPSST